jgi:hypothetical protein
VPAINSMKTRLQSLALLDRAVQAAPDDELVALVAALPDDHRAALAELIEADGDQTAGAVRAAVSRGRMNGVADQVATVLADPCLADCIEALGDHAENPDLGQLQAVLPGLVERHGLTATRLMLTAALVGEAPASAVIRELLKHDELVALPAAEAPGEIATVRAGAHRDDAERAAVKAARKDRKAREAAEARLRREQSARDRGRV